jgi:hypothetical protein
MAKRKVIWSLDATNDLIDIMNFYNNRNKSKIYSRKLYHLIQHKLKTLDFSISLPQKTSDKKLFYFTQKHIFIGFDLVDNDLNVLFLIDERRSPDLIKRVLTSV